MRKVFGTSAAVAVAAGALSAVGCGGGTTTNTTGVPANGTTSGKGLRVYRELAGSMEPTLTIGRQVKVAPLTSKPSVGEIVVFHPPKGAQRGICGPFPHVVRPGGAACAEPQSGEPAHGVFIKRIVAGPGDEIYIREGHVYRRATRTSAFTAQPENFIKPCPAGAAACNFPTPIRIPAGHWFMMGDNRREPDDSRLFGPVPTESITGVVLAAAR